MRNSKTFKKAIIVTVAMVISQAPAVAWAEAVNINTKMISTAEVFERQRSDLKNELERSLIRDEVQAELIKHGVTVEEAQKRLATLSSQEVQNLSGQIKEARAGGDVLTTILIVILIIFLVQRI